METSSREARRRRIVDRGSDRLALIAGRIQSLPPSSSSPESFHSHTASCPPSIDHDQDLSTINLSHQRIVSHVGDENSSSSLLLQHQSFSGYGEIKTSDGGSRAQPILCKSETSTEALRAPSSEVDGRVQSSRVLSTVHESSVSPSDTEYRLEPKVHRGIYFTPNQISSAIAASENIRICCSLAVAILVVLSYVGFPILGSRIIKSIIFFRPLYLVLLTNISIMLARLLLAKQRGLERTEQEANNVPSVGEYGLAEQLGKALESGLVLQNIMGAVFMDCSVYAIVVICGLSMAHRLGW